MCKLNCFIYSPSLIAHLFYLLSPISIIAILLNFYHSFSILFSTHKSPKTLSILFEHRTLFKSSQTKFERRAYKRVHFVSQKKMLFLFFFFFFFSRQVSKRWQVESFKSIRKRGCCFSRRSSLYRNRPRATLFIFLYVLLPLLEAIRRPRSSKHPFLAARTRNLREMVSLYCHQVFTSTRFAFYHARKGKIREIHGGWG